MDGNDWLAARFEENRSHLRAVAYRMLGSLAEADDAVQEAWLHAGRADVGGVANLGGWLTTVVARVCLDMLRSRRSRREEPWNGAEPAGRADPEHEAVLADSVGLALLVVLDALTPAERLAFVLHDMFAVPFDDIAPIVGRSPTAARQLASRARRRVRGVPAPPDRDLVRQEHQVRAFLAASRDGDFDALLAVLHRDVEVRTAHRAVGGARAVAGQALTYAHRARFAEPVLVDGVPGIAVAPRGRLVLVMAFTFAADRIASVEIIVDPARLARLVLRCLP